MCFFQPTLAPCLFAMSRKSGNEFKAFPRDQALTKRYVFEIMAAQRVYSGRTDFPAFIRNKLFFETFLDVILYLQGFCSPSSCWELHFLLNGHLHRSIDGRGIEHKMAVPVFDSVKDYLKKVNLKSSRVICHVLLFETAIKSFCFRNKCSKSNFSRVLFDCTRGRLARETRSFGCAPEMVPEVLRLRGGAGGDEEKWLCETCGKILASKRNLDLHMSSVHVSHEDFDCVMSDGVLKWRCSLCCNLVFQATYYFTFNHDTWKRGP